MQEQPLFIATSWTQLQKKFSNWLHWSIQSWIRAHYHIRIGMLAAENKNTDIVSDWECSTNVGIGVSAKKYGIFCWYRPVMSATNSRPYFELEYPSRDDLICYEPNSSPSSRWVKLPIPIHLQGLVPKINFTLRTKDGSGQTAWF